MKYIVLMAFLAACGNLPPIETDPLNEWCSLTYDKIKGCQFFILGEKERVVTKCMEIGKLDVETNWEHALLQMKDLSCHQIGSSLGYCFSIRHLDGFPLYKPEFCRQLFPDSSEPIAGEI